MCFYRHHSLAQLASPNLTAQLATSATNTTLASVPAAGWQIKLKINPRNIYNYQKALTQLKNSAEF